MKFNLLNPGFNLPHRPRLPLAVVAAGCLSFGCLIHADMVTDWNATLSQAILVANELGPVQARKAAIVQLSVYDAVNGIARKYQPYLVTEPAPGGARQEAAAAMAAYTALVAVYPAQKATFDAQLAASLLTIPGHRGKSQSIARGLEWGETVANEVLTWRNTDGFSTPSPPIFGGTAIGEWRSVPDGTKSGALPGYRYMTPFFLSSASQFRPGPPPDLTSAQYAADFNETKSLGGQNSSTRTAEQTQLALLWQATSVAGENAIARSVVPADASLVDNARLFALLNMAVVDAIIVGFDCKYTYMFWRPYHAIHFADQDGNPDTTADTTWNSLVQPVPNHPEYLSFHSITVGLFMAILRNELGDNISFTLTAPSMPGVSRTYNSFSEAADEVKDARIWGGLHFSNSCNVGQAKGNLLADYVLSNFLLPVAK